MVTITTLVFSYNSQNFHSEHSIFESSKIAKIYFWKMSIIQKVYTSEKNPLGLTEIHVSQLDVL